MKSLGYEYKKLAGNIYGYEGLELKEDCMIKPDSDDEQEDEEN